jgi:ASC-1-like (ASCH) protein
MPAFLTKKEVFEWIRTGRKNVELRRGKIQNGDVITFLNGRSESISGRILRKKEGKLEDVLNTMNYNQIIPTAKNLDEAKVFIRRLYPSTRGTFTTYEFEIEETRQK